MEKLKETFRKRGFEYRLVERSRKFAIYGLWASNNNKPPLKLYGYEVTKISILPEYKRKVDNKIVIYPRQENICRDRDFGKHGWSYPDLDSAKVKFDRINK